MLVDLVRSLMEIGAGPGCAVRSAPLIEIALLAAAILIGSGSADSGAGNDSRQLDDFEDDGWCRELVDNTADPVILASEGRLLYGNPAFRGHWPSAAADDPIRELFAEEDRDRFERARLTVGRDRTWRGELMMRPTVGAALPVEATLVALDSRTPERYVLICRDLRAHLNSIQQDLDQLRRAESELAAQKESLERANTELTRQAAELEAANSLLHSLATTDGLTGLKNHRAFQERLAEEFERARRYETPLSVILLDVDQFKQYNDTYGHQEGDRVLKILAGVLDSVARDTDYLARYGGEEFIIVLPNTDREGAVRAAERYRAALEAHVWPQRSVTASLGIATVTDGVGTPHDLVEAADRALYRSKEAGRNCLTHIDDLYTPDGVGDLLADAGLPYTHLIQELLQVQQAAPAARAEMLGTMTEMCDATIQGWARLLGARDKETVGHTERVTELMIRLARMVGMNTEEVTYARWGALLHDIGKMGIPDALLHKESALTDEEWDMIRRHPTIAYEMLASVPFLHPALDIPYCHHEKWDGTGYPRGLAGNDIPLTARLFAVIDVYDSLTHDRPYRKAWSKRKTIAHLKALAGTQFDLRAVRMFLAMLNDPGPTRSPQLEMPV